MKRQQFQERYIHHHMEVVHTKYITFVPGLFFLSSIGRVLCQEKRRLRGRQFISMDNEYVTSDVRSNVAENAERREVSMQRKDSNELSVEGIGRLSAGRGIGLRGTVVTSMKK
jgi:hypothetical protein